MVDPWLARDMGVDFSEAISMDIRHGAAKVKATARVKDVLLCKRNAKREGSSGVILRHRDLSFLRRMENC